MLSTALRAALATLVLSAPALAQETPDPRAAVAMVNGAPVELGDLVAVRQDLPEQYQQLEDTALYDALLRQITEHRMIAIAAEASGVGDTPRGKRLLEMQRRNAIANLYMESEIEKRVTEEKLQAAYDELAAATPAIEEIRASHILVKDKEAADALKTRLDDGADFAELAREHGTDGAAAQGGDLGWFQREAMVPAFAEAAFAIEKEGDVAGPIETRFGWHLIKLTGKREAPKPTFDETRDDLQSSLFNEAALEIIEELRASTTIDIPEDRPGLAGLRDDSLLDR